MQAAARPTTKTSDHGRSLYAHLSPAERYIHETRDEAFLALLQQRGTASLAGQRIIELACGGGSFVRSLARHGADPRLIEAFDIDPASVTTAHRAEPLARIALATAATLPYRDASFDLACAFTAFSSIVEPSVRAQAAQEAVRVLRPGGHLIVYDFRINPLNPATKPLHESELRSLFPSHRIKVERVTLAPPIVRFFGGRPTFCRPLENLPLLRTHLLACIQKEPS